MKIAPLKKSVKQKHTKKDQPRHGVLFTEVRGEFEILTPVKLSELGVIAPKAHRPQFSAFCKNKGLRYASLAIDDENAVYFLVE